MALKLKTAVQDLYRRITGVPKSELKTQGQMIREDYSKGPGLAYTAKSALLNTYNYKNNLFRPKGGKAIHAALDAVAPIISSLPAGILASNIVNRATLGSSTYAGQDQMTGLPSKSNLQQKYGLDYNYLIDKQFPTDVDGAPEAGQYEDLVPVRIGKYQFRGAIGSLTDTSTPTWTGASYAGRPDQVYSYSGVDRTVSFDLKVYAISHRQLRDMYQRVNKLYELTRPIPDAPLAPTRMSAPLTRLVIGDYLREQVIMTALTVTPIEELAWEINDPDRNHPSDTLHAVHRFIALETPLLPGTSDERYIVPKGLNINMSFTVLHDEIPTSAAAAFRSKTDAGNKSGY